MNQKEMQKIGKSLLNAGVAAVVALYMAGQTDVKVLVNAGIAAVLTTLARYVNPKDASFGLGKKA
jgi:uncharacterized membrane protein YgaE (UPF0421/DUF939 family)